MIQFHTRIGRSVLLVLPVGPGVVRSGTDVFVQLVCSIFLLEINMIYPVILRRNRIIVCINIVAVRAGKVAKDLLIHNGDLSLYSSLPGIDIRLGGWHDRPAS